MIRKTSQQTIFLLRATYKVILGIGTDIIAVKRIKRLLTIYPQRFSSKILTSAEQVYCQTYKEPAIHIAGRFAAKEAIVKALGTGFRNGLDWQDIEIINDLQGKPCVKVSEKLSYLCQATTFHLSISHCEEYATAMAIWTRISQT